MIQPDSLHLQDQGPKHYIFSYTFHDGTLQ